MSLDTILWQEQLLDFSRFNSLVQGPLIQSSYFAHASEMKILNLDRLNEILSKYRKLQPVITTSLTISSARISSAESITSLLQSTIDLQSKFQNLHLAADFSIPTNLFDLRSYLSNDLIEFWEEAPSAANHTDQQSMLDSAKRSMEYLEPLLPEEVQEEYQKTILRQLGQPQQDQQTGLTKFDLLGFLLNHFFDLIAIMISLLSLLPNSQLEDINKEITEFKNESLAVQKEAVKLQEDKNELLRQISEQIDQCFDLLPDACATLSDQLAALQDRINLLSDDPESTVHLPDPDTCQNPKNEKTDTQE